MGGDVRAPSETSRGRSEKNVKRGRVYNAKSRGNSSTHILWEEAKLGIRGNKQKWGGWEKEKGWGKRLGREPTPNDSTTTTKRKI